MTRSNNVLALDIGEVRVGVAVADRKIGIAVPIDTMVMNEDTFRHDVAELVVQHSAGTIVVGYPRNQGGDTTQQTAYVESMASQLSDLDAEVVFQDESLTSVTAKERLGVSNSRINQKGMIDAEAAAIILQDYLELYR